MDFVFSPVFLIAKVIYAMYMTASQTLDLLSALY